MSVGGEWERVYTVHAVHDGPVLGIAHYQGTPHIYEAEFNAEKDKYTGWFRLDPIDAPLLALVMEDWDIWLRWKAAHAAETADITSHPALPPDQKRHGELRRLIGDQLHAQSGALQRGEFRIMGDDQLEVRWCSI